MVSTKLMHAHIKNCNSPEKEIEEGREGVEGVEGGGEGGQGEGEMVGEKGDAATLDELADMLGGGPQEVEVKVSCWKYHYSPVSVIHI